jgi:hypothetical protein
MPSEPEVARPERCPRSRAPQALALAKNRRALSSYCADSRILPRHSAAASRAGRSACPRAFARLPAIRQESGQPSSSIGGGTSVTLFLLFRQVRGRMQDRSRFDYASLAVSTRLVRSTGWLFPLIAGWIRMEWCLPVRIRQGPQLTPEQQPAQYEDQGDAHAEWVAQPHRGDLLNRTQPPTERLVRETASRPTSPGWPAWRGRA